MRRLVPYALAITTFTLYTTQSLWLHRSFQSTGFDLGIFEQIARSYAHDEWPIADLLGPGRPALGDHFHPILALLGPVYLLFPSPETLLIAQAALFATSVVPITRLAAHIHGLRAGSVIGTGYGLSWGLQSAVGFDFHEICFAVPLLAFAMERLVSRQWTAACAYTLPLVLVKEDQTLTVTGIGLYLLWQGQRRLGALLTAIGTISLLLLTMVVMPAISPDGGYDQFHSLSAPLATPILAGADTKIGTILALLAPTAFVALRSPILTLALPTLAWRFASGTPSHWGIYFHYSAVLMPIVFVAFIDGLQRSTISVRVPAAICLAVTGLTTVLALLRPPGEPEWTPSQQATARHMLGLIPDGATVAASNRLAPQLTNRCTVLLYTTHQATRPQWIVVDKHADLPPTAGYTTITDLPHVALYRSQAPYISSPR